MRQARVQCLTVTKPKVLNGVVTSAIRVKNDIQHNSPSTHMQQLDHIQSQQPKAQPQPKGYHSHFYQYMWCESTVQRLTCFLNRSVCWFSGGSVSLRCFTTSSIDHSEGSLGNRADRISVVELAGIIITLLGHPTAEARRLHVTLIHTGLFQYLFFITAKEYRRIYLHSSVWVYMKHRH